MRPIARLTLAALLALGACGPKATPEGAAHLTEVFQRYLGTTPGVVSVTPDGDSYQLVIDANPLLAKIPAQTAKVTVSPQHLTLTEKGHGLWEVAQDEPVHASIEVGHDSQQTISWDKMAVHGVFDEKAFCFQTATVDRIGNKSVQTQGTIAGGPKVITESGYSSLRSEVTGTIGANGGCDMSITLQAKEVFQNVKAEDVAPENMNMQLRASTMTGSGTYKGVRAANLLDLTSWLLAHPSEDAIISNQEDLRTRLQTALPIFEGLNGEVAFHDVTADTAVGKISITNVGMSGDFSGLTPDGHVSETFTVDGLALPEGLTPAWAKDLVPTSFSFGIDAKGFDLASPARMIVDNFDLTQDPPISPLVQPRLKSAIVPDGSFDLTIIPGTVTAPLYTLTYDGAATVTLDGTPPTGQGLITLTGIEGVIDALNKAPSEVVQTAGPAMALVRGMSKPGENGTIYWKLDATQPGKFTVNGLDLAAIAGMMP